MSCQWTSNLQKQTDFSLKEKLDKEKFNLTHTAIIQQNVVKNCLMRNTGCGSKGIFNQNKWCSKLIRGILKRCCAKVQMIFGLILYVVQARFCQRVTEKQSMKKSNLALCHYHSDLNCKLVFFNDGLEKEFEWHLCKVHNPMAKQSERNSGKQRKCERSYIQTGYRYQENFDLWEWHFRMIILTGMKKNMDWSDQ